jgi:outer membrane protein assembly factor BamB
MERVARNRVRAGSLAALLALVQPSCDVGKSRRFDGRAVESALAGVRAATHRIRCPAGSWPVYAHDSARSGASRGCCRGPLTPLWRFDPPPKPLRKSRAFHAIVSKDSVYASGVIGESPALFAIGLDGRALWTFDSHVDITRYEWPAYVLDRVVLDDDGLYIVDPRTGQTDVDRGMDSWGQVIDNGKNLFATNTWYVAGPKTYVGALEPGGAPLWKQHEYGVVKEDVLDRLGGLALSQDRLLFAPNYHPAPGAGVYAYRPKDGGKLWSVETLPSSHASVAGESVYLFEHPESNARPNLVCRDIDDGKVRWKIDAASPERAPPVVALGLALFRAEGGAVVAVHRGDGTEAWRTALHPPESDDVGWSTSLAGATGSGTLLAIDGGALVVLELQDGSVQWRGRPASAKGALHSPVIAAGRVYVADQSGIVALACAE